ncbi:MAG: histidine kinase [Daejeonella sp.]
MNFFRNGIKYYAASGLSGLKVRVLLSLFIAFCTAIIAYASSFLEKSGYTPWMIPMCFIITFILWETQELLSVKLDKKYSWSKSFYKRLLFQMIWSSILSFFIINIPYLFYKIWSIKYYERPGSYYSVYIFLVINGIGLIFYLMVTGLQLGLTFIKNWKESQLASEKLKKESTQAKLESLKNQVNPHFLFNNLNILTVLIDNDPNQAKEFVEKFAEVYRYLLKSKDKELVSVETELDFISSYLYLLKIRFEKSIYVTIDINPAFLDKYIPPLALQLLIENVIKHNVSSLSKPLYISIYTEQGFLVVKNNLQLKEDTSEGTNTGLQNITNRYAFLSEKDIVIKKTEKDFIVCLPLLDLIEYTHS